MNWQSILAVVIVIAAALWLCRRVYRIVMSGSRDGAGHVSGCGTCSNNPQAASASPLIQFGKPASDESDPVSLSSSASPSPSSALDSAALDKDTARD